MRALAKIQQSSIFQTWGRWLCTQWRPAHALLLLLNSENNDLIASSESAGFVKKNLSWLVQSAFSGLSYMDLYSIERSYRDVSSRDTAKKYIL